MFNKKLFDKYYWCAVILTTLMCFGFTLTNYSIGIDDPTLFWYIDWKIFLQQGRWGYEWISPIVNVSTFLPCWIDLLSVLLYLLTSIFWVNLFYEASNGKFQKTSGIIFACLYVSFPYLAETFIFMISDLFSAFNMLFASLATWSTWLFFEKSVNRAKYFIFSVVFLAVGFGCYESTVIYFVCGMLIAFFLKEIYGDSCKIKTLIFRLTMIVSIILTGVLLSKIILHILLNYYKISGNNYAGSYFAYNLREDLMAQVWYVIKELLSTIFKHQTLVDTTLSVCIVLFLLLAICNTVKRRNINSIILVLGIIISNFAIVLGTGNIIIMQNAKRILVTYGLFSSFSISIIYTIAIEIMVKRKWKLECQNFIKYLIILVVAIWVLKQSREMMGTFWVDHQRAVLDEKKAGYINYEIEKTDWENKPVVFVGFSRDYLATQEKDPLGSYFNFFKDRTDAERNNYIRYYMGALGYVYPRELEEGMLESAVEDSTQQSSYPLDGYVTEYNEYIVVKLGPL